MSAQNLEKFSDGLFKVAKETGAAFRVAADAATEYARQGLGVEESLKRTRDALVLTRLTGMDSAEAVKSLTAAMNTYGTQIKDTTQLVSKFAAVDVKFAVSAQDFADAISRTGQSAQSAGVSIDELVGIVTAAQQKTARGGAVIGNALKTIFTKTGKTDTLNQLENLGIAVRDLEGNTIGAQRILNDLANTFDTLSAAQKAQITQTMGGLFHINILKAVLSDAAKQNGIMAEATRISAGATDEAIQKNEELRKTMSAVATETGLAIKQVSTQIGEIALAPGMEKILNSVKSLAEGLSGVLGDGESTGSSFATGLLKGIGNVITGPGLVVLAGVFFKLFGQALKFTKESLTSLVGVTTEKQKQKAIQTSLVALFGQNAALNKEMLRTDIGRTEKEKIILGLLRAQVVEASSLNKLTAGMAGTLYRKGYGANLTPVGKKASGHIPNYANPERAQAAQGGYAAGNIRSMNMPGEGSVIYNSAEKVKNFKGMSQPAIMPPHSSKAGKNYQQAFGSIHGFDPYAAGGYIPNYAVNIYSKKTVMDKNRDYAENLTLQQAIQRKGISSQQINRVWGAGASMSLSSQMKKQRQKEGQVSRSRAAMLVPPEGYMRPTASYAPRGKKSLSWPVYKLSFNKSKNQPNLEREVEGAAKNIGTKYSNAISQGLGNKDPISKGEFTNFLTKAKGSQGAIGAAVGSIFEAAANTALRYSAESSDEGGDFDIRGGSRLKELSKVFHGFPAGMRLADYKNSDSQGNRISFYNKLIKEKAAASGFIPNFADPLSDAIGREKAAGVPVSQIRVGSHGALMGKGNPLGLGVTNTHDEPNGLRDVFGANGFVPNYVDPVRIGSSDFNSPFSSMMGDQVKKFNKIMARFTRQFEQGEINFKELQARTQRLGSKMNLHSTSIESLVSKQSKSIGAIDKLNAQRRKYQNMLSRGNAAFNKTGAGKMLGSTGGQMGIMMGLPMAAGFFQDTVGGKAGASIGGALSGAGTGASMGMIFGPLGTAIGGAVGGLYGFINGLSEAEEAAKNKAAQDRQQALELTRSNAGALASTITKNIDPGAKLFDITGGNKGMLYKKDKRGFDIGRSLTNTIDDLSSATFLEGMQQLKPSFKLTKEERSLLKSGKIPDRPEFNRRFPKSTVSDPEKSQEAANIILREIKSGEFMGIEQGSGEFKAYETLFKSRMSQLEAGKMGSSFEAIRTGKKEEKTKFIKNLALGDLGEMRKEMLKTGLSQVDKSTEFFGGEAFSEIFGESKVSAGKISSYIDQLDSSEVSEFYKIILSQLESYSDAAGQQAEGIILQLNLQKIMLESQKRAKQAQFNISASMQNQASNLSLMEKTMGGFATEQQKAQFKYIGSINKAAETYASSAQQAENAFESNMLGVLKDDDVKSKVKTALAKKIQERDGGTVDANKLEVSDEFLKLSQEERQAMYKELKLGDDITKNIENQVTARENALSFAEQQVNQSNSIAQAEFKINDAIARRKDLISDMKTSAGIGAETVGSAGKIRAMDAQVDAAERLGAVGPGYQTSADQEAFQMKEKRIALQNKSLEIQEQADKKMNDELIKLADLKMQEAELVELKSFVGPEKKEDTEKRLRDIAALEATGEERKKQQEEILGSVERINKEAKKEISTAEKLLALEEKRLAAKRAHETGPGAFKNGLKDGMKQLREDTLLIDYQLSRDIPQNFANGLAGAMTEALSGAKDLDDALRDAGIAFLKTIQQAMMQKAANNLVGMLPFSRGGNVRKYSQGGGVPAMVSDGEYVMGGGAVNKYGGAFMHGLNAGGNVPAFSNGGKLEGFQYKSGRAYQSKKMSGAFYGRADNVGLREDASSLAGALADKRAKEEEAIAKAKEEAAKYNARVQQIVSTVASIAMAGVTAGMQGSGKLTGTAKAAGYGSKTPFGVKMATDASGQAVSLLPNVDTSGFSNVTNTRSWNPMSWGSPSTVNPGLGPFFWNKPKNEYYGGPIRQYASGGHISGKSGIDQIPAMLSEGEYVIRASSARQIGKPMLDRINAGKFNDGGPVDKIAGSEETSGTSGNTNNINISVNIESGSVKDEKKSSDNTSVEASVGSKEKESGSAIADKIKQQVLSVIVEEQRPGGLLSD